MPLGDLTYFGSGCSSDSLTSFPARPSWNGLNSDTDCVFCKSCPQRIRSFVWEKTMCSYFSFSCCCYLFILGRLYYFPKKKIAGCW